MSGAHAAPRPPLFPALAGLGAGRRPLALAGGALATAAVVSVGVVALDGAATGEAGAGGSQQVVGGQRVQALGDDLVVAASGRARAGAGDLSPTRPGLDAGGEQRRTTSSGTAAPAPTVSPRRSAAAPSVPTAEPAPEPAPAPSPRPSEPDAVDRTTTKVDDATGGATAPLTGALEEPVRELVGTVEGVLDPTLGGGGLIR